MNRYFPKAMIAAVLALATAPLALAQNFVDDVTIDNPSPDIEFNDTSTDAADWEICVDGSCNGTASGIAQAFNVSWTDGGLNGVPFVIQHNTDDYLLYLDDSDRIGILTNTPLVDLHIYDEVPEIRLEDSDHAASVDFRLSVTTASFEGSSGQDIIQFDSNAPASSLDMTASGNIGIGTTTPAASVEVQRTDGSARILVEELNAVSAPRTLFKLSNGGNTKFEIAETKSGNTWAFTNSGVDFRISLQSSGVVEYRVDNAGNAFLQGTLTENSDINDKQAIVAIDEQVILDKVTALPVSQWQYKDTDGINHIGPMAQDFYKAFELGASDTGISSIDTGGVALASIKALAERNARLEAQVEELAATVTSLKSILVDLQYRQQAQTVVTQAN